MDKKLIAAGAALLMTLSVGAFAQTSPNTANSPGGTDAGTVQAPGAPGAAQTQPMMSPNTANSPGGTDAGTVQKPAKTTPHHVVKKTTHHTAKTKPAKKHVRSHAKPANTTTPSGAPTPHMSPNTANSPGGTDAGTQQ